MVRFIMGSLSAATIRLSEDLWLFRGVTSASERQTCLHRFLTETLGCGDFTLSVDGRGKPLLGGKGAPSISLSHRGDMLLVGIAPSGPVGVDIEMISDGMGDLLVAQELFAPDEARWLESVEDKGECFTRLWTAKEAVLKAVGIGIVEGAAEPDFSPLLCLGHRLNGASASIRFRNRHFLVRWHAFGDHALAAMATPFPGHIPWSLIPRFGMIRRGDGAA